MADTFALDPFSSVARIALLPYMPRGVKIGIVDNAIRFYHPTLLDTVRRSIDSLRTTGCSKHSLFNLEVPFRRAVAWYAERAPDVLPMAREGLEESRHAIQALRAEPLDTLGLVGAVRALLVDFQSRTGISADFRVAGTEPDLSDEKVQTIYRVAEEALANAQLHAGAERVAVHLSFGQDRMELCVRDDGQGFVPGAVEDQHYGLLGMRERAEMIGAELELTSRPGGGTQILLTVKR